MNYTVERIRSTESTSRRLGTEAEYGIFLLNKGTAYISGHWNLGTEDLMVAKPGQGFTLEYPGGPIPLDGFWVRIPTELMQDCSTEKTDLLKSFAVNPLPLAKVRGQSELLMLIKRLAAQMALIPDSRSRYGEDLLEEGTVKMFLALVLRACILSDLRRVRKVSHLSLDEVFAYIHAHLSEEITLERLEEEFYVSRYHLIRQFKIHTGQTVHQYIVRARLDRCCQYIEQGYPITEVYRKGGFGGYNNFFKAFKHNYGMTPKEFYYTVYPERRPE